MEIIYLDYNCFQRLFDDPTDPRIRSEAFACLEIFRLAAEDKVQLVWSFMHDDEVELCPFPDRKAETILLATLCRSYQEPTDAIRESALNFVNTQRISAKDALHLASAIEAGAEHFLTCDDVFLHRVRRANLEIALSNPVEYTKSQ